MLAETDMELQLLLDVATKAHDEVSLAKLYATIPMALGSKSRSMGVIMEESGVSSKYVELKSTIASRLQLASPAQMRYSGGHHLGNSRSSLIALMRGILHSTHLSSPFSSTTHSPMTSKPATPPDTGDIQGKRCVIS